MNFATFNDADQLATHCLVYYVRGVASDLKFCLSYFATSGAIATQIMSTFWTAVSILELEVGLRVIAAVSDGAAPNRSFYRIHLEMDETNETDFVYRVRNVFATDDRYIYFFADAPHLLKTLRNAIYHSGDGKGRRMLWNHGIIIWEYFTKLVFDEMSNGLKLLPKLTLEHVKLNPYSIMTVRLAAQIMSESVSNVLYTYYPKETHLAAEFCKNVDKFFDCANTRNQTEGMRKRKEFLQPFTSVKDVRFEWLKDFLGYFEKWRENIKNRDGNFTASERDRMFIPWQTYQGLKITVHSIIECTKYLLSNGMEFVLTERFNQDVVEEFFGRQRSLGRRNDNPTLYQFGYQSNILRMQRSVAPVTGNTRGAVTQKRRVSWDKVDDDPLKKRRPNAD